MYYKQKYIESIESLKSNINGLTNEEAKYLNMDIMNLKKAIKFQIGSYF